VVAAAAPRAQRYGIQIDTVIGDAIAPLRVDRIQAETILHNLVGNAIEALLAAKGARKRIRIDTRQLGAEIEIRVCDNGPGIAEDIHTRLFPAHPPRRPVAIG
jgi:signal transduction histidine kinase